MAEVGISYRRAEISDLESIWSLYRITYGKYEPMNMALGDMEDCIIYYGVIECLLEKKLSIVAIDNSNNKIVGFVLNNIIEPFGTGVYQEVCEKYSERETDQHKAKNKILMAFLSELSSEFLKTFAGKRKFINSIGGVHLDYSKRGIHAKLCEQSEQSARENHCDIIYAQATSKYSQANFEKLGFEVYGTRYYKDFLYNGEKVWPDVIGGIHDSAKLYHKDLNVQQKKT